MRNQIYIFKIINTKLRVLNFVFPKRVELLEQRKRNDAFSSKIKKISYHSFRYSIKEQDLFKHKSVLDSFLKYDHKDTDKLNKQDHRIVLTWAQWWNQLTQESILLPRISPEGKCERA